MEEAAGGEEFGVEQGGAGGAADEIVREQGQFYIEQGTFADAADYGGHAVAGIDVAARLRAIFFVEHDNGITQSGGQSGQLGADFESCAGLRGLRRVKQFFSG